MSEKSNSPPESASAEEILAFLTEVMRSDENIRERMKAAELLGKGLGCFEKTDTFPTKVVIVDDLSTE